MTLATIVDGWLLTGDLGRFDSYGHLQLFGRKKNMIVTEGGKNIIPKMWRRFSTGCPLRSVVCLLPNYLWPRKELGQEKLVIVLRLEQNRFDSELLEELTTRNRRLPDFKRVGGYLIWEQDFPRTASMKIKRQALGEEIGNAEKREAVVEL